MFFFVAVSIYFEREHGAKRTLFILGSRNFIALSLVPHKVTPLNPTRGGGRDE